MLNSVQVNNQNYTHAQARVEYARVARAEVIDHYLVGELEHLVRHGSCHTLQNNHVSFELTDFLWVRIIHACTFRTLQLSYVFVQSFGGHSLSCLLFLQGCQKKKPQRLCKSKIIFKF